jgi:hypothetical protein
MERPLPRERLPAIFASCMTSPDPASAVTAALVVKLSTMATWRSGYATVCKTVYPGSIPGVASNFASFSRDIGLGHPQTRLAA